MRRTLAAAVLLAAAGAFWTAVRGSTAEPYAPAQPIDFSHAAHVGVDRLECELCHSGARRSPFAGIAPVERCMGCHRYVLPQHPEIVKVRRAWDAGKSIPWVKVNTLPQFVHFSHEAHALGGVGCDTCHGNVAAMPRVVRTADLTMGWCVQCHRDRHAPDDCLTCHY